jgi:hypothetical protein
MASTLPTADTVDLAPEPTPKRPCRDLHFEENGFARPLKYVEIFTAHSEGTTGRARYRIPAALAALLPGTAEYGKRTESNDSFWTRTEVSSRHKKLDWANLQPDDLGNFRYNYYLALEMFVHDVRGKGEESIFYMQTVPENNHNHPYSTFIYFSEH